MELDGRLAVADLADVVERMLGGRPDSC
jgi:hypothetical protein